MSDETREFTVVEARALLPEVRDRAELIVRLRADLAELTLTLHDAGPSTAGGVPEVKALEAHSNEAVVWFGAQGIVLKGIAPLLIDFPAVIDGRGVQLCWLEGEIGLNWYHRNELGFAGRRPLG